MGICRLPLLLVTKILALLNSVLGGVLDPLLHERSDRSAQKGY